MYLSKAIVSSLLFFINFCLLTFVLSVALNVTLVGVIELMLLVGLCASTALAALSVLLGAVASTSKLRGVLMPLLALPLLFPLFFAGVELTTELVLRGAIEPASVWISLLVVINALYLVLGVNLFEVAVRD
jgi:ABC-type transport system involved in cytochrome c biogenesis permease component